MTSRPVTATKAVEFSIDPVDNERLANLNGPFDEHLKLIERRLGVEIQSRGGLFRIIGDDRKSGAARDLLLELYDDTSKAVIKPSDVDLRLQQCSNPQLDQRSDSEPAIETRRGLVRGRGPNQIHYLKGIERCDIAFGIGPAGTGKTYLAVASAIKALESEQVERLVLVRPAVEAGERLGFLPGDMVQKIDPYLRPLYDALYEMLGFDRVARLIERNVIEIAPLAFMRGRTLNDAFIILDEAQNTTTEQMKMFLTRIGFGSTAVVTGDVTQIDLPGHQTSGLKQAMAILSELEAISFTFFEAKDVVRHPIVQQIVSAYARFDQSQ